MFEYVTTKKVPLKTERKNIPLGECVLPWIEFKDPKMDRTLNFIKSQVITETKGAIKDLTAVCGGVTLKFGTGGLHGSVNEQVVRQDDEHILLDLDVTSYYPSLSIHNKWYPEHLGPKFCDVY